MMLDKDEVQKESSSDNVCSEILDDMGILHEETSHEYFARRFLDITVSLTVLLLTLPLILLIAVIIRLDSPGPAFFWQVRMTKDRRKHGVSDRRQGNAISIGSQEKHHKPRKQCRRNVFMVGRPFWFLKFRTMYVDARERFPEMYRYEYSDNELDKFKFKEANDPRVTRVGAFLRCTSLDELPNFWCVLRGDMTLVGPRPEIPEMSPYYKGEQLKKFHRPSAITGLAQIRGRGNLVFQDSVKLDIEYVKNRSLLGDLSILWETIKVVLLGKGAY